MATGRSGGGGLMLPSHLSNASQEKQRMLTVSGGLSGGSQVTNLGASSRSGIVYIPRR